MPKVNDKFGLGLPGFSNGESMVIAAVLKLFGLKLLTLISGLQELFWWWYMLTSIHIYLVSN